jgi:UDP-2,3-diacylglucosamine pyrophosphatase LpxH
VQDAGRQFVSFGSFLSHGMDTVMENHAIFSGNRIRSIFVSDVHLGTKYCHAEALAVFLQEHEPEYIYLVGDFIDGWSLKRAWHWRPAYNRILHRLLELAMMGSQIRYAPGNHDAFLRTFCQDFGFLEIADELVHHSADNRYYLVTHGDQFDNIELRAQWLSVLGSLGYDFLIWVNRIINRLRRCLRLEACAFTSAVKSKVKQAVKFISRFEERLAAYARKHKCDGVICGHIHTPTITTCDGITYCNTGDWVENCSALVEYENGQMEILQFSPSQLELAQAPDSAVGLAEVMAGERSATAI